MHSLESGTTTTSLCCGGHANLAVLRATFGVPGPGILYVAMLRDPATRIASALAHDVRRGRVSHLRVKGELRADVRQQKLSINGYLTSPSAGRSVNHAVAMFAAAGSVS